METRSYPALTTTEEAVIHHHLACLHIVELTPPIKEKVIALRRRHRLKLPDAIIAATAQELGAVLATPEFERGISKVFQSVGRRYAQHFNFTYRRTGTLWEGRHRATVVDSERYEKTGGIEGRGKTEEERLVRR